MLDAAKIGKAVCASMCADVEVFARDDGRLFVETPFEFDDGDTYSMFLEELPSGGIRVTDCGHTFMQLSYEMDVARIREGTRGSLLHGILAAAGIQEEGGVLFVDSPLDQLGEHLFRFGQAITRLHDVNFLRRDRAAQTFYEDLAEVLGDIVPSDTISREFFEPAVENAENYPIDFRIETPRDPLFVFGVGDKVKAQLATIVLQQLLLHDVQFESLVVYQDQQKIDRGTVARLTNVAGAQVSSLDARTDLKRKIEKCVA